MIYLERHLTSILIDRFEKARSVYLFGARQTGKTTLARRTFPNLPYVSLESPDTLESANRDPRGFLSRFPNGGIIDEVQRFPGLFSYLQEYIDIGSIKFLLTGSQNFLLQQHISQSLAGRISLLKVDPFSQSEIMGRKQATMFHESTFPRENIKPHKEILESILTGGYPKVNTFPDNRAFWFGDYVATFVERDVRHVLKIQDLMTFQRFLGLCAGRSGSILNYSSLANDTGISENNCKNWLSVLETSGILFRLQPYLANTNKRLIKSPKLYFSDTGLLCHLLRIKTIDELRNHPLVGSVYETYVVNEIYKSYINAGATPRLYYWRDKKGVEIDCIIEENGKFYPIEIKMSQTFTSEMQKNLKIFSKEYESIISYSTVVYGGENQWKENNCVIRSVFDIG